MQCSAPCRMLGATLLLCDPLLHQAPPTCVRCCRSRVAEAVRRRRHHFQVVPSGPARGGATAAAGGAAGFGRRPGSPSGTADGVSDCLALQGHCLAAVLKRPNCGPCGRALGRCAALRLPGRRCSSPCFRPCYLPQVLKLESTKPRPERGLTIVTQLSLERFQMLENQCSTWPLQVGVGCGLGHRAVFSCGVLASLGAGAAALRSRQRSRPGQAAGSCASPSTVA